MSAVIKARLSPFESSFRHVHRLPERPHDEKLRKALQAILSTTYYMEKRHKQTPQNIF